MTKRLSAVIKSILTESVKTFQSHGTNKPKHYVIQKKKISSQDSVNSVKIESEGSNTTNEFNHHAEKKKFLLVKVSLHWYSLVFITHIISVEKNFTEIRFSCTYFLSFFNVNVVFTHMESFVNLDMKMTSHFPEVMGVAFPLRKCF